jgi:taurine dioxygenase
MEIKLVSGALGAEVSGIDLTKDTDAATYKVIRELLVQHEVLFFRDQDVSPAQQHALASSFGPLQSHPAYDTVENFPEITILESTAEKPSKIECWHSDMTFRAHPPLGTVLRSKIIPEKGGDTLWSSMTAAYDALSPAMQSFFQVLTRYMIFLTAFEKVWQRAEVGHV